MNRMNEVARLLWLCLGLAAVGWGGAGCSGFTKAWKAAAPGGPAGPGLAGRWEGTWKSDATGHQDSLRCLVSEGTNGLHQARFQARYRKVFRWTVGYSLPLQAEQAGDATRFQGQANLGWLAGGTYRCVGTATATNFHATYESKYDRGTFDMVRPPPEP